MCKVPIDKYIITYLSICQKIRNRSLAWKKNKRKNSARKRSFFYFAPRVGGCSDEYFGCLVEFLRDRHAINQVIAPDESKCSILIKNKNTEILFLNNQYHKFSNKI